MKYLDSSVFLRIVLRQRGALPTMEIKNSVASELLLTEALRTIDRLRFQTSIEPSQMVLIRDNVFKLIRHTELILLSRQILRRAASPFSVPLGTLDAIHLSTAILWRERTSKAMAFLTHDRELELAAKAEGFPTLTATADINRRR